MRGAVVFAVVVLVTALGLLAQSLALSSLGRLAPLWVLVPMSALAALQLLVEVRGAPAPAPGSPQPQTRRRQIRIAAWLAGLVACVYLLGFLPAATVFLFLFLRLEAETRLRAAVITTSATIAFVYVVFGALGGIRFPEGLLF
jgi:hypothetical protein